jgi:hypothetical protein
VHPPLVLDARAGLAPQLDRLVITADLEPDLLEKPVSVMLDTLQTFFRQELVGRNFPGQVGWGAP